MHFLTNFSKSQLPLYNFVNNFVGIGIIKNEAFDCFGRPMSNSMSLHVKDGLGDLDTFWRIFEWVEKYQVRNNGKLPTHWDVFKAIQCGFAELRSMAGYFDKGTTVKIVAVESFYG